MSIFDDILGKNADDRLAEEMLYAEAMREIEQGIRRDGLWGKAIADSEGDDKKAKGLYLKLRVQALKDELEVVRKERIAEEKERIFKEDPDWQKKEIQRRVNQKKQGSIFDLFEKMSPIAKIFWALILVSSLLATTEIFLPGYF